MRCARPKKNRRICSDVTEVGAEIWTDDVFTKALNCPFYEEDGTEKRDYADLDEETRLFWKSLHEEYYNRYLSDCKTTEEEFYEWSFIGRNKEMKEYLEKRADESNIEAE